MLAFNWRGAYPAEPVPRFGEVWPQAPDYGALSPAILASATPVNYLGHTWYGYCADDAVSYAVQRSGDVFRFEVRSGDTTAQDIALGNENTERAELNFNTSPLLVNTTYSMEFLHYVQAGVGKTTGNDAIIFQLHADKDAGDIGTSPPFRINVGNNWRFDIASAASAINPLLTFPGYKRHYSDRLITNRWHHWKVRWRHDWTSTGLLQVWQNGVLVTDYSGPLGYNDVKGIYPQIGIYRGTSGGVDPDFICLLKLLSLPTPEE